jgi:hypothetical protein
MPPAAFSRRAEAQSNEAYVSPLRLLRPCWTAFLNSLRELLEPSVAFFGRVFSPAPNGL